MMVPNEMLLAALLALLVTLTLTPWLGHYLLERGVVDHPGERRSHDRVTPRGGGLAMAAGLWLGLLVISPNWVYWATFSLLVLVFCLLGWLDDRFELSVRWRLLVQLTVAVLMVVAVAGVQSVQLSGWSLDWPWLWSVLAVPAIIWVINLHNFMDGADGLAASQGIWSGLGFGLLFLAAGDMQQSGLAFLLSAVCLGFLVWNRPSAKIFMGDSGSLLLGGLIAWLALSGAASGAVSIWSSLVICSLFATDATATLLLRLKRGRRWYTPHRQHAYQRLLVSGWSHGQVLLLYSVINGVVVLAAILIGVKYPELDAWLALGVAVALMVGWWCIQSALNGESMTHD